MDTIRYLLSFLVKTIFSLLMIALVFWLFKLLFPQVHVSTFFRSGGEVTDDSSWLPAPGSFKGLLLGGKAPTPTFNEYVAPEPYNGYGTVKAAKNAQPVYYVRYTSEGVEVTSSQAEGDLPPTENGVAVTANQNTASVSTNSNTNTNTQTDQSQVVGYSPKSLYMRNLSMYEGGHIYTGFTVTGEARSLMFIDGKFPVIVADKDGKLVTVVPAVALSDPNASSWVKFRAKVTSVLPVGSRCTVVFEQARQKGSTLVPARAAVPVICN